MSSKVMLLLAACLGAAGIAIGAFGAHSLPKILGELSDTQIMERKAWLETGVRYHMYHVPALMALAVAADRFGKFSSVAWLWLIGVLIFSGCLYVMSLTGIRFLGRIVPIGGLSLLIGWVLLAIRVWTHRS